MKVSTITTILGFGLSVSAAPQMFKRLNRPDSPKSEAAVASVNATAQTTVWVDGITENAPDHTEVEIFLVGPAYDPNNTSPSDIGDIAVNLIELANQLEAGTAEQPSVEKRQSTTAEKTTPKVTVWIEEPREGADPAATTIDVHIAGPEIKKADLSASDLREVAIGVLTYANSVDAGAIRRPGPYVPGFSGSIGGLLKKKA